MAKGGKGRKRKSATSGSDNAGVTPTDPALARLQALFQTPLTRRKVVGGAVGLTALLAAGYVLIPWDDNDGPVDLQVIPEADVKVKWEQVFNIDKMSTEPEFQKDLKEHVAGFMDVFERGVFPFLLQHPQTGDIVTKHITGQQILSEMLERNERAKSQGLIYDQNVAPWMRDGRISITSYGDRTLTEAKRLGGEDIFAYRINLGQKDLTQLYFTDTQGKERRSTLEGHLMNEIAHAWYGTGNDRISNAIQGIVVTAMGWYQRDVRAAAPVRYGSDFGLITLYNDPNRVNIVERSLGKDQELAKPDVRGFTGPN